MSRSDKIMFIILMLFVSLCYSALSAGAAWEMWTRSPMPACFYVGNGVVALAGLVGIMANTLLSIGVARPHPTDC